MRFADRSEAGRQLAERLSRYEGKPEVLVLGLPRGGLPVAYEVASALKQPLDLFLVRKLGVPSEPELAMGAIASGSVRILNREVVEALHIPEEMIREVTQAEEQELARRERLYRDDLPAPALTGKTVILVDDGIATGSTVRSAVSAIKKQGPDRLIIAAPTVAASTFRELQGEVDEVVAVIVPESFYAVGQWYVNFSQTTDEEVKELLARARSEAEEVTISPI